MTKKKPKDRKKGSIMVTATRAEYREAGAGIGLLCLWGCAAFGMEPTLENAQAVYRLAQERAQDAATAVKFSKMWN